MSTPAVAVEQLAEVAPMVRRICVARLGVWDGEDAAQDALVRIWRMQQRPDYTGEREQIFGWAKANAQFAVLNTQKAQVRHPALPLGDLAAHILPDPAAGPETYAERLESAREATAEVRELIEHLAPRERQVLLASGLGMRSNAETAARVGISKANVSVTLQRAVARMREAAGLVPAGSLDARKRELGAARTAERRAARGEAQQRIASWPTGVPLPDAVHEAGEAAVRAGWSRTELAREFGVSNATISRWQAAARHTSAETPPEYASAASVQALIDHAHRVVADALANRPETARPPVVRATEWAQQAALRLAERDGAWPTREVLAREAGVSLYTAGDALRPLRQQPVPGHEHKQPAADAADSATDGETAEAERPPSRAQLAVEEVVRVVEAGQPAGESSTDTPQQSSAAGNGVDGLLQRLSSREQQVMAASEMGVLPDGEIAARLGISKSNARNTKWRAIERLREFAGLAPEGALHERMRQDYQARASARRAARGEAQQRMADWPRGVPLPAEVHEAGEAAARAGWSRKELADEFGVGFETVRRWQSTAQETAGDAPADGLADRSAVRALVERAHRVVAEATARREKEESAEQTAGETAGELPTAADAAADCATATVTVDAPDAAAAPDDAASEAERTTAGVDHQLADEADDGRPDADGEPVPAARCTDEHDELLERATQAVDAAVRAVEQAGLREESARAVNALHGADGWEDDWRDEHEAEHADGDVFAA